jgi:hypothetical protein
MEGLPQKVSDRGAFGLVSANNPGFSPTNQVTYLSLDGCAWITDRGAVVDPAVGLENDGRTAGSIAPGTGSAMESRLTYGLLIR